MRAILPVLVAAVPLVLVGCSATPHVSEMVPKDPTAIGRESTGKTIRIELPDWMDEPGGWEKALGAGGIDPDDYYEALRAALGQSGLFFQVDPDREADYTIVPVITNQGADGVFEVTAILFAKYDLQMGVGGEVVWSKEIMGRHTASCMNSPVGAYRLRSAREGAVRDGLTQLVRMLAELDL